MHFSAMLCANNAQPRLKFEEGTNHALAVNMVLTSAAYSAVVNQWSSLWMEGSTAFEVNLGAMQAIKTIRKGATELTDFLSVMHVSLWGLHHKRFWKHLKAEFSLAGEAAAT